MSDVAAIELVREQAGRFLGYRGALLALPSGWEAWNAYRSRALVGSLAVFEWLRWFLRLGGGGLRGAVLRAGLIAFTA